MDSAVLVDGWEGGKATDGGKVADGPMFGGREGWGGRRSPVAVRKWRGAADDRSDGNPAAMVGGTTTGHRCARSKQSRALPSNPVWMSLQYLWLYTEWSGGDEGCGIVGPVRVAISAAAHG